VSREDPETARTGIAVAVVADGDVPTRAALDGAWPGWATGLGYVVAADGGAERAAHLGLRPDLVVGDMDSLGVAARARLEAAGVPFQVWPAEKDASDLELALQAALARDPAHLVLLGVFGGERLDHALAGVVLLSLPELIGRDVVCLDAGRRVRLLRGPSEVVLQGPTGDLVTLLPFGVDALGVRTSDLAYPLHGERLRLGSSRGLSNVRITARARVSLRAGLLLVIETHQPSGGRP
jgi:thiamine pyrophosphokinase